MHLFFFCTKMLLFNYMAFLSRCFSYIHLHSDVAIFINLIFALISLFWPLNKSSLIGWCLWMLMKSCLESNDRRSLHLQGNKQERTAWRNSRILELERKTIVSSLLISLKQRRYRITAKSVCRWCLMTSWHIWAGRLSPRVWGDLELTWNPVTVKDTTIYGKIYTVVLIFSFWEYAALL